MNLYRVEASDCDGNYTYFLTAGSAREARKRVTEVLGSGGNSMKIEAVHKLQVSVSGPVFESVGPHACKP